MAFPELNVRTYVKTAHRAGVWFFSPDAANWLAVRAARWLGMPYCDARVSVESAGESIHYQSARNHKKAAAAEFKATYGPTGPVCVAAAGTLDHWLTERYCLFSALRPDRIVSGEIHHSQWILQPAAVELRHNTMVQALGIKTPRDNPPATFPAFRKSSPGLLCRSTTPKSKSGALLPFNCGLLGVPKQSHDPDKSQPWQNLLPVFASTRMQSNFVYLFAYRSI